MWSLLPNKYVIGAVLIALACGYSFHKGYSIAEGRCEAAALRAQLETTQRDLANSIAASADDQKKLAASDSLIKNLQDQSDEYAARLAAQPLSPVCAVDDDLYGLLNGTLSGPAQKPAKRP